MSVGTLKTLSHEGDTRITWDTSRPEEVKAARKAFKKLVEESRYLAYRVEGADRGEVIREFDPQAGEIVMVPPLVGG